MVRQQTRSRRGARMLGVLIACVVGYVIIAASARAATVAARVATVSSHVATASAHVATASAHVATVSAHAATVSGHTPPST